MLDRDGGPLDWLLQQLGGVYMSDLRYGVRGLAETKRVRQVLKKVPAGAWTGAQWTDAAGYLTGIQGVFATQDEAVGWLIRFLEKT